MQDFDRLIARFRQFGGMRLVWQYAKMGVLWLGIKEIIRCILHGRSLKAVYPVVTRRIDPLLLSLIGRENEHNLPSLIKENTQSASSALKGGVGGREVVWFCWLQGMENAPELVKTCLRSLRENVDAEIMVLDESNYGEYVELPEYIVRKYRKGIIPPALFSDMLRLELLIRYGGTWIDSTVWASPKVGAKDSKCWQAWQKIQESELFIYRYFNREGRVEGMSNWFIHAEAGNALLKDVRDMLYAYWHDYNCTVEYYIFHLFFSHVAKRYPEMIRKMPKGNSYHALWLRDHIDRPFDEKWWENLTANVPFHKLNYRKVPKNLRGTYYEPILKGGE